MDSSVTAFLFSGAAVVLAEMGDKTQLLAMAFATKYRWWKVMIGVFAATILNHALAVAAGTLIGRIESIHAIIQVAAAASFVGFGLWTLKGDQLEGEDKKATRVGPILTVGLAFFMAEMGDKTQLATIALGAKYPGSPAAVLVGTTTGMVIADGFGIIVGVVLCRRIPERIVKVVSAFVFMLFGLVSTFQLFMEELAMGIGPSLSCILAIAAATAVAGVALARRPAPAGGTAAVAAACEDRGEHLAD